MTVLVVVGDPGEAVGWHDAVVAALPEETVVLPGPAIDRSAVTAAIVAAPPPGSLQNLPRLGLIQGLWAGVDALLADPTLPPGVPLARLVDPALTASMVESVLLHVLWLHRQMPHYRQAQASGLWAPRPQKAAAERPVGVLGLGALGQAAAAALAGLGFPVTGWSRTPRAVPGVRCLDGEAGLQAMLSGTEILVNLLPLTPSTEGLLSASLMARLAVGASLVNLGRGGHLVEADLLAALESGQIDHAVLDVLAVEPAPPDHAFWNHPRITLTPHVAAPTHPGNAALIAADAVRAARDGRPVGNLVDRTAGY